MELVTTSIYEKIAQAWIDKKRHIFIEGGTAASKTYSVLQFLTLVTQHTKSPLIVSVISESVPHLKRGAMRDFFNILGDSFNSKNWNKTDSIYIFGQGRIEFFSADEPSKLRGGRRDILFCNEINNIAYDGYRELDARTRLLTIADWNPVSEFFLYENGLLNKPDTCYIHATYKDALNVLPPEVVTNI
jgi:phage terminase large subunit